MLKNKFYRLAHHFSTNEKLINSLWREIHTEYTEPHRHYHTLKHLEHIYKELEGLALNPLIEFAIFYHDIVYNVEKNNNEEESALLACKRLNTLGVKEGFRNDVSQLILLSKRHEPTAVENYKLFLDADIGILGASPSDYERYIQNIRKEYCIYAESTYNNGRKKVLSHFLEKPRLYQSDYFYNRYEEQARTNILTEYHQIRV
ncbi:hypothetical protein KKC13_06005 [bacterium]|nr:hypothetical protein [bacterium]MBU1958480.1 hypothetical protein [bacterium]